MYEEEYAFIILSVCINLVDINNNYSLYHMTHFFECYYTKELGYLTSSDTGQFFKSFIVMVLTCFLDTCKLLQVERHLFGSERSSNS